MNIIVFVLIFGCLVLTILLIREKKGCLLFGKRSNPYQRYHTFFDSITTGVIVYGRDCRMEYINAAALEIFGLRDEDVIKWKGSLYDNPLLSDDIKCKLKECVDVNFLLEYNPQEIPYETSVSKILYVDVKIRYTKNKKNLTDKCIFILNDITKNKEREIQLEHSELILRMSLKSTDTRVWRYDIKSQRFYSIYGQMLVFEGASMNDVEAIMCKEHYKIFEQTMSDILLGKTKDSEFITEMLDKNGKNKYYRIIITTIYDHTGNLSMVIGSHKDISDDYQYKQELTETLLKTRLAIKTSNIIQWDYNPDIKTLCVFDSTTNNVMISSNPDEYNNSIHPDDRDTVVSYFQTMVRENHNEGRIDTRLKVQGYGDDWQYVTIDCVSIRDNDGKMVRLTGFLRNNTKFIELNESLKEKNIHLNMVLKAGSIIPIVFDCKTNKFDFSIDNQDSPVSEILDLNDFIKNIHPQERGANIKILEDLKSGVIKNAHEECRYNTDGEYQDVYDVNYLAIDHDNDGVPSKIVGYIQNISSRKAVENEISRQRELMMSIFDKLPIPIHIKDVENGFRYIYWNRESTKVFGDMLFKSAKDVVGDQNAQEIEDIDQRVFETEEPYIAREIITSIDGSQYDMNVHKDVIYHGDKKYILIVRWDVSKTEELYRKSKILSISMNALKAFTWYCDIRDGVLRFGEEFEKIGGNPSELNSMYKFAQRIHPDHREEFLKFMDDFVLQDSGDFAVEYKIDINNDGVYQWWECRGTMEVINSETESYKYLYGMDINIDSHKQAETELDNLNKQNELILNNSNQGLAFIDINYKVQWQNITSYMKNQSFLANYKKGSICHKTVKGLDVPCPNCVVAKSRISGMPEIKEVVGYNNRTTELTAIPIYDDSHNLLGTVLKVVDITEKKKVYLELETAKYKAEESNMLKSAFLANMSHEIRTPLNSIVGFSELLVSTDDVDQKDEYFSIINANNELLLCLINDILDLSKIEAGMINLKPTEFDVSDLFKELELMLRRRITGHSVELICEVPYNRCTVVLDKGRFTQVITNFVTNSIKFTRKGYIKMSYEYTDGELIVRVEDTGIGISKDNMKKVFQRFEKLNDFAQGTGLGMAICKAIIEAHNGEIGVDSKENQGSMFWIKIPIEAVVEP